MVDFYRNNNICYICKSTKYECKVNPDTKFRCCSLKCNNELMEKVNAKKEEAKKMTLSEETNLEPGSKEA